MFAVRICIYTDDDFGYEEPEFDMKNDEEKTFYFENRKDVADALIRSFHNLKNSLRPCGRDYIRNWVYSIDNRIELITKKIPTFVIEKDSGNQFILYELLEAHKTELNNGSYCFNLLEPNLNFSWYREDSILWDELENLSDLEQ